MNGCSFDKNCTEALGKQSVRMTCAIDQRFPDNTPASNVQFLLVLPLVAQLR